MPLLWALALVQDTPEKLLAAYDATAEFSWANLARREELTRAIAERALDAYRERYEGEAALLLERGDLRAVHDRFILTEAAVEATLRLAAEREDAGDRAGAARRLERLLLNPSADRALVVARLLSVTDRLEWTRGLIEADAGIVVGGRRVGLREFAASLEPPRVKSAPVEVEFAGRTIRDLPPDEGFVRNDIRLAGHTFAAPSWTWRGMPERFVSGVPLVDGDVVYACDGAEIVAIDAWEGRRLWLSRTQEAPAENDQYHGRTVHKEYGNVSPLIGLTADGGRLYTIVGRRTFELQPHRIVWLCDRLVQVDRASGRVTEPFVRPFDGDWTYGSAPVVCGGRLYTGVTRFDGDARESAVVCHDAESGRLLWTRTLARIEGRAVHSLPVVLLAADAVRVYATDNDSTIAALRIEDGATAWSVRYEPSVVHPRPISVDDAGLWIPSDARFPGLYSREDGTGHSYRSEDLTYMLWDIRGESGWQTFDRAGNAYVTADHEGALSFSAMSPAGVYLFWARWKDPDEARTISVSGGLIAAQGESLGIYTDANAWRRRIAARAQADPFDTDVVYALAVLGGDPDVVRWFFHLTEDRPSQRARRANLRK